MQGTENWPLIQINLLSHIPSNSGVLGVVDSVAQW